MRRVGPDELICYCYHVPLRKLEQYARRERPSRASQLSQCLGAGTGCGWCIPILKKIHEHCAHPTTEHQAVVDMTAEQYAAARDAYRRSGGPKNTF